MKDRADKILVNLGLVRSRSQAQLLIKEGKVYYHGEIVKKAGQIIMDKDLEIKKEIQYVGRGAHKLEGALDYFKVEVQHKIIADVGASTGGFSDLMLKKGVSKIYAIDVGHDQLAPELITNEKIINMEGINIKYSLELPEKVDLCVVDLSFISLKLTLKNIFALLKDNGMVICLVKPQFEAGKSALKGGIVVSREIRQDVLSNLYDWCYENNIVVTDMMKSPVIGKNGNIEYFFHLSNGGLFYNKELINNIEEES